MSRFERRKFLKSAGCGLGYLAFADLATRASTVQPHFAPRAKRVIFLFMHGGPSQVDTFDYKPQLQRDHDAKLPFAPAKNP